MVGWFVVCLDTIVPQIYNLSISSGRHKDKHTDKDDHITHHHDVTFLNPMTDSFSNQHLSPEEYDTYLPIQIQPNHGG